MNKQQCPTCGSLCEVQGDETKSFIPAPVDQEPVALRFPTMLRKMWSGGEVQSWIDKQGILYTTPQIRELSDQEIIQKGLLHATGYAPDIRSSKYRFSLDDLLKFGNDLIKASQEISHE